MQVIGRMENPKLNQQNVGASHAYARPIYALELFEECLEHAQPVNVSSIPQI